MKIIMHRGGHVVDIYAVYWVGGNTYFYGLHEGNGGLSAYKLGDGIDIIDSDLSGNFVYFNQGVFYKPLIEERLLDDLLEYDETAYKRFLEILKAEGRIDPDFC
ncbi:hypothetical protein [Biostraticola tofi]|uniref:Uncharacterized protein n=1 Tax=Biostraticola tofi TaxID=466109 RepID=A0A4R3YG19_9GAMM|nr:hypothetical protein [Biostraticola tofi]TCV91096.1 hypothetical protein EDC52_1226 [Biostraticola tofi]